VLACGAWRLRQRRALVAVAGLGCVAALLPALPALADFGRMLGDYTEGRGDWIALESVLFGQRSPLDVPALWQSGRAGAIDIPLSALLAPFAIARQPIRLWGDALLDPVGGALAALGLALCARRARREAQARFVLLVLAAALLPAFVSSYDRASLTRLFAAPVILALLSGVGFRVLQRAFAPGRGRAAALVVTLCVSLGGTWLFDAANPRILRASWLSIALESLASHRAPRPPAVLLSYGGALDLSWLHVGRIASHVPERPLPWLRFDGPPSLAAADEAGAGVLLWSPALEADAGISRAVCARWPRSTLYTLEDRPGRSRARAASLPGTAWAPSLPPTRWSAVRCPP
jgi:hypothetical protein